MYIRVVLLPAKEEVKLNASVMVWVLPEGEIETLEAATLHWLLLRVPLPPGVTGPVNDEPLSEMSYSPLAADS